MPAPPENHHRASAAGAPLPPPRLLGVAALAGLASYLVGRLPEPWGAVGIDWGAGLLFGALVLAPQGRSWIRRAGLLAASALVYRGAVWLAVALAAEGDWPEVLACALAGALGAPLLAFAAGPLLGRRARPGRHLAALIAGAAGGALIGVATLGPDEELLRLDLPMLAGYVVWQVGWAAAHGARADHRGGRDG
jgi:hypothetical protein